PAAFLFRGEVRIEDLAEVLFRNSDASVGDGYPDIRPGLDTQRMFRASALLDDVLGAYLDLASVRHGLLGVDEHVAEHLDELGLVCRHGSKVRRDVKRTARVRST